ncbi:MAG: 3'(2'),5'-bisphosphate nucleotidase CysQ [Gammaproteobacteria bacterium]
MYSHHITAQEWIKALLPALEKASKTVLHLQEAVVNRAAEHIDQKLDGSIVTKADLASQDYLVPALEGLGTPWPIVSEENTESIGNIGTLDTKPLTNSYWLIDPLDGTREYAQGTTEFTINIALIENHYPVFGIIVHPHTQSCYWAAKGQGFFKQDLSSRKPIARAPGRPGRLEAFDLKTHSQKAPIVAISRHSNSTRMQAFLDRCSGLYQDHCLVKFPDSAMKLRWLAEGKTDVYPRFDPISEWDVAAGQCLIEEMGGQVLNWKKERLSYGNNPNFLYPQGLIAFSDAKIARFWLEQQAVDKF